MANKNYNLVFKADLEIGGVKSAVAELNKILQSTNITIPKNINNNLTKLVNTLNTELNKIEGLNGEALGVKEAKQAADSYNKINSTLQQLKIAMRDIQATTGVDPSKFFPKDIKTKIEGATQALENYKKVIEKGPRDDSYQEVANNLKKAQKALGTAQEKQEKEKLNYQAAVLRKERAEEEKAQHERERRAAEQDREEASRRKAELNTQRRTSKQQIAIQEKINAAKEKEKKHQQRIDAIEEKKEITRVGTRAYDDLDRSLTYNTQQLERAKRNRKALEKELELAKQYEKEYAQADSQEKSAKERLETSKRQIKNDQSRVDKESKAVDNASANYQAAADAAEEAREKLSGLTQELNEQKQAFDQQNLDVLISEFKKLGIELPQTQQNLEGIEKVFQNLSAEAQGNVAEVLKEAGIQIKNIGDNAENLGTKTASFGQMADDAERTANEVENLKRQIFDFFSIGNAIQIFKNTIREAFNTVKELDAAMTETAVVTNFSIGDMWEKLPEYSKTASELGSSIKDLYGATTLYYQQGLNSDQAMSVGIETMKMARIANMEGADATKAMTAALRGFNMEINETSAKRVNDVYSELAAITAADTQQIATAMTKTASIADSANMDFEVTAALLAQIIETTQEAPETAGTALKTIIARFTEVKELFSEGMLTGKDSEGEAININKIDAALQTVGISLKDFLNGSKGIDNIFLELASKWNTLDLATQRYIATTAAGSRQQSRFIAMMSNYDRTMELVGAANDSAGASNEQFDKTLDSLDAKLERLNNAWQEFTMNLANNELIKFGVDFLADFLETINSITEALSGGNGMIKSILTLGEVVVGLKTGKDIFNAIFSGYGKVMEEKIPGFSKIISLFFGDKKDSGHVFDNVADKMAEMALQFNKIQKAGENMDFKEGLFDQVNIIFPKSIDKIKKLTQFIKKIKLGEVFTKSISGIKKFGKSIGLFVTTPLGQVMALLAAFKAVKSFWENINLEAQTKKVYDNFEALKSATEASREELNKITEAQQGFQDLEDKVHNLTEGTLEWKEAVAQLNEKVLELKQIYPELELVKDRDIFTIDESSWGAIIDKQQQTVNLLEDSKVSASLEVDEVEYKKKLLNLISSSDANGIAKIWANVLSVGSAQQMEKFASKLFPGYISLTNTSTGEILKIYTDQAIQQKETLDSTKELYEDQKQNKVRSIVSNSVSEDIPEENKELVSNIITAKGVSYQKTQAVGDPTQPFIIITEKNEAVEKRLEQYETQFKSYTDETLKEQYSQIGGGVYKNGELYTDGTYSQIKEVERQAMIEALSVAKVKDEIEQQSIKTEEALGFLKPEARKILTELFSSEGQSISTATLSQFYQDGALNKDAFIDELDAEFISKSLDISVDKFYDAVEGNLEKAEARVIKQRTNIVKNLSQYGNTLTGQVNDDATMLALLEAKFGDYILETFDSAIKNLEYTGDKDLISAGIQGLQATAQYGTKADVEQIANFISEVNWSSPIEAASALNDELKTGTNLTKEFAQGMLNVNSSFLGAGSQIQHLWDTASDTGLSEALDEIIAANGEITGADIAGLTKDYQSLDKMLKNTGISASGVAKALDMISKGEMNIQSLTNAVAASLAGFGGFSDMINDIISQIGEWDMGTDEGQIGDFTSQLYETANELISSGQRGNTQLDKIFGLVYGHDYLRDKVGDERKAALEAGLEGIAGLKDGNMSSIWNKIGTLDASAQEQAGDLRVSYKNGEALIDGYEGMTTAQIVENIRNLSQAAGFSDNEMFAKMLLGDASNYSDYIRPILSQNDLDLGLDRAYDAANEYKDQKVMDESEIEAIAQLYNEDASEVKNKLLQQAKENGEKIAFTDFYDENGQLKDTEGILQEIVNTQIKLSGTTDKVAYTTEGWIKRFGEGTEKSSLKVHELQQELANMGVPDDKIDQMTEDMVDGLRNVEGEAEVEVKLPDGSVKDITVKAGQSFAQAYEQAMKQFEYDSIGKALASALVDMDIDANGIYEEVHGAVEEANENAIITIKNEGAEGITEAINTAIKNANKTVKLNVSPTTIEISGSASGAIHLNAYKDGIVNASYAQPALVGEEGPELVETANGAYLAGVGGPEVTNISKGDTVHTASETKKILKGNRHKQIPRFSGGKPGPTLQAYGDMLKGSGGSGKDDAWETSIDKLYNLLREIQEETRYRNSIERRYERMLESLDVSATQLVSLSRQELSQLQEEKQLQEQLIKGRQDQIAEYMQDNQDFTKYAWVEQNERGEDVLRVDWEMINGITDKKLGEDVSKYLSQLEGWFGDIEGAQDSIDEIEDQIFEINQRGKDEYFDLEEKIKDALVSSYQDEIDKLSEINDTINDTNSQIIQSIQDSVSRMRQERENQQTEEDLDTLRQRLSYLQQDTSGANAQEILELQKEIDEKSQDYTDSLIDQKITKLQEQNDDAAEQRKMQIEVMQQQLEHLEKTGEIWTEVQTLMKEGLNPDDGLVRGSKLEEILQKSENFAGLSTLGKMRWLEETNKLVAQGLGYLYQGRQLENLGLEKDSTITFKDIDGKELTGKLTEDGDVLVGDTLYKDVYQGHDGKYYSLGDIEEYVALPNTEGLNKDTTVDDLGKPDSPGGGSDPVVYTWKVTSPNGGAARTFTGTEAELDRIYPENLYRRTRVDVPSLGDGDGPTSPAVKLEPKSALTVKEDEMIPKWKVYTSAGTFIGTFQNHYGALAAKYPSPEFIIKKYAKGGLADFTGPAWLDGTKSRPEYVLNAQQTKSFFTLVDTLESLKHKPSNNQTENYGDTIYDIDINIETVKEEADVDMLVDKVQKSIVKASQYRNTNLIRR